MFLNVQWRTARKTEGTRINTARAIGLVWACCCGIGASRPDKLIWWLHLHFCRIPQTCGWNFHWLNSDEASVNGKWRKRSKHTQQQTKDWSSRERTTRQLVCWSALHQSQVLDEGRARLKTGICVCRVPASKSLSRSRLTDNKESAKHTVHLCRTCTGSYLFMIWFFVYQLPCPSFLCVRG